MSTQHYILMVWEDIEPDLHGPFLTAELRDERAHALRREHGPDHGYYPLTLTPGQTLTCGSYSGAFFEPDEDDGEEVLPPFKP